MGEDEKKSEEKKREEERKEEKVKVEEKKEEKKADEPKAPPPPPQNIVLKVYMHCEGCATKVRRCLKGFEGVEEVSTDCKTHKVVVKGEKADPVKVLERIQKKSNRQVELISPIPKPSPPQPEKTEEKEAPKPEEKNKEPQVVTVVLSVQMHCEACAEEIKRRILKMKGVENVEPDLKSSLVTVKGVFDPPKLIEYIHKRTGKHVSIVKQEPEKKKEEPKPKPGGKKEKKPSDNKDSETPKPVPEEKKDGGDVAVEAAPPAAPPATDTGEEALKAIEAKKIQVYYTDPVNFQIYPQPQRFDNAFYPPAPQMFSDENPNACIVM